MAVVFVNKITILSLCLPNTNSTAMYLSYDDMMAMPQLKRATLLNYFSGFKNASLIATMNNQQQHNVAIFNSVVHIGANPPYLGFIQRPLSVARETYENIKSIGYYTINHVHLNHYPQAHQTSAKYKAGVSEFEAVGLTPAFKNNFPVPYVQESIIQFGLQYQEEYYIQCNETILVIGKILEAWLPDNSVAEDGHLNLSEWGTVAVTGLDTYHITEKLAQMPYARSPK
jgi:flavin reductase (DIM6/NTAB) family NADH-FMN oxidoreductase RutF